MTTDCPLKEPIAAQTPVIWTRFSMYMPKLAINLPEAAFGVGIREKRPAHHFYVKNFKQVEVPLSVYPAGLRNSLFYQKIFFPNCSAELHEVFVDNLG